MIDSFNIRDQRDARLACQVRMRIPPFVTYD